MPNPSTAAAIAPKCALIGNLPLTCNEYNTKPAAEQQLVRCVLTVQLPKGQITFQGLAQGTSSVFAVTGGSGAYYNVHGQALAVDRVPLSVADVTITLYRD